jgi:aspartate-semialdehyde dehydrogenase
MILNMERKPNIAVVGASGAVGEVMLSILAERGYRTNHISALASERSMGDEVEFGNAQLTIENLAEFDFSKTDYALFSAGGSISKEFAPKAAAAGAIVKIGRAHV